METQEKMHVPIYTGVNKDIFLQEIYPQVKRSISRYFFGEGGRAHSLHIYGSQYYCSFKDVFIRWLTCEVCVV